MSIYANLELKGSLLPHLLQKSNLNVAVRTQIFVPHYFCLEEIMPQNSSEKNSTKNPKRWKNEILLISPWITNLLTC